MKTKIAFPGNGQKRIVIEKVSPNLENGLYPLKAIQGDSIPINADIIIDGNDLVSARILYKSPSQTKWQTASLIDMENNRWSGWLHFHEIGYYEFKIEAWIDHAKTWLSDTQIKIKNHITLDVELSQGISYLQKIAKLASKELEKEITSWLQILHNKDNYQAKIALLSSYPFEECILTNPIVENATQSFSQGIYIDRPKAQFSAWYTCFPRSTSKIAGQHGTFKDVEALLPRLQEFGFDTLHFPPIHPIGTTNRKGKNNADTASSSDPGVPNAIGSNLGGHESIHPELGSISDFKKLIEVCKKRNIDVAIDLAIQCSPDHPWVKSHPEWFTIRPDGSIKPAEMPPQVFNDIYPLNFECADWQNLWLEIRNIVLQWAEWGIRTICVDNPHTKSFHFWKWLIAEVHAIYPDMIWLSKAFTKPKVKHQLSKIGFTQSITYFTWRNSAKELSSYLEELTQTEVKDYLRPNFFPSTPDILPFGLQTNQTEPYLTRLFLAATLSSNYGVYGPAYELMYHEANFPKEEFKNAEKYEIKHWNWEERNKITHTYTLINRIRKENTALQLTNNLTFCETSHEEVLAYVKVAENGNRILAIANIGHESEVQVDITLPLSLLLKGEFDIFKAHNLFTGERAYWQGEHQTIHIDSRMYPFLLFRIED
jgi:starch synthase (maltosyl-transferring)